MTEAEEKEKEMKKNFCALYVDDDGRIQENANKTLGNDFDFKIHQENDDIPTTIESKNIKNIKTDRGSVSILKSTINSGSTEESSTLSLSIIVLKKRVFIIQDLEKKKEKTKTIYSSKINFERKAIIRVEFNEKILKLNTGLEIKIDDITDFNDAIKRIKGLINRNTPAPSTEQEPKHESNNANNKPIDVGFTASTSSSQTEESFKITTNGIENPEILCGKTTEDLIKALDKLSKIDISTKMSPLEKKGTPEIAFYSTDEDEQIVGEQIALCIKNINLNSYLCPDEEKEALKKELMSLLKKLSESATSKENTLEIEKEYALTQEKLKKFYNLSTNENVQILIGTKRLSLKDCSDKDINLFKIKQSENHYYLTDLKGNYIKYDINGKVELKKEPVPTEEHMYLKIFFVDNMLQIQNFYGTLGPDLKLHLTKKFLASQKTKLKELLHIFKESPKKVYIHTAGRLGLTINNLCDEDSKILTELPNNNQGIFVTQLKILDSYKEESNNNLEIELCLNKIKNESIKNQLTAKKEEINKFKEVCDSIYQEKSLMKMEINIDKKKVETWKAILITAEENENWKTKINNYIENKGLFPDNTDTTTASALLQQVGEEKEEFKKLMETCQRKFLSISMEYTYIANIYDLFDSLYYKTNSRMNRPSIQARNNIGSITIEHYFCPENIKEAEANLQQAIRILEPITTNLSQQGVKFPATAKLLTTLKTIKNTFDSIDQNNLQEEYENKYKDIRKELVSLDIEIEKMDIEVENLDSPTEPQISIKRDLIASESSIPKEIQANSEHKLRAYNEKGKQSVSKPSYSSNFFNMPTNYEAGSISSPSHSSTTVPASQQTPPGPPGETFTFLPDFFPRTDSADSPTLDAFHDAAEEFEKEPCNTLGPRP